MLKCEHCLLEFSVEKAVYDEIDEAKKVFCCSGCRGVYHLINSEGLSEFYDRREEEWFAGPPGEGSLDIAAIRESVRERGDESEIDLIIDGIRCASCIWLIEKLLEKTEGVTYARVNYATHRARIRWRAEHTDIEKVLHRIQSAGYNPKPAVGSAGEDQLKREQRDLLIRFGTAAFFSMQLMMYSVALYAGYFQGMSPSFKFFLHLVSLAVATPVFFYGGMPFIMGATRGLKTAHFNMDVLIVTGAGSAYFYSIYQIAAGGEVYFDTSAMIITLILLGRYLEIRAKGRASEAITRLVSLSPKEARVVKNTDEYEMIPLSKVKEEDLIHIKPGERIPLDGFVIEGASEVDESMLTGESVPVDKKDGSEVFCGTQNLYGSFIFQVARTGDKTVLSHIIRTVEDAQARKAPVQALADRLVGYFVPVVLCLSMVTAIMWLLQDNLLTVAVMNAVSVLVIACPCALGLATPLAILVGTTDASNKGIMIKGGDIIERAKKIDTVALDKTGTLTEGRPRLSSYRGVGMSNEEALYFAASLERYSEHSIARSIVDSVSASALYMVDNFRAVPGKGVMGEVNGNAVQAGSRCFIESTEMESNFNDPLSPDIEKWIESQEGSGSTLIYLSVNGNLSGLFAVSDSVRKEAEETVKALQASGLDVILMTGDEKKAALHVGSKLNLKSDKVMARVSPIEKAEAVKGMQNRGRAVMMVGDGINDAPALVQSDVGIAMGRATDIALESADIVLMRSDLGLVHHALMLSKKTYRVIRQNLFWAFMYNIIALPLAVAGVLHPIIAALAMTLSSLSVVGNSLRLKKT
jgi:Cu2+-exporting ATPase